MVLWNFWNMSELRLRYESNPQLRFFSITIIIIMSLFKEDRCYIEIRSKTEVTVLS